MKTFTRIADYFEFTSLVRHTNRYRFDVRAEKFLDALLSTAETRNLSIPKGTFFWRSQLGKAEPREAVWEEGIYGDSKPFPYPEKRMKPRIGMASEGRANPKGIPYLYLSTDRETAIAECRPWIQSYISAGRFQTTKGLAVINCSSDEFVPLTPPDFFKTYTSPQTIEKVIWGQINKNFTAPIHRSDHTADYTPTQVIAEYFKSKGFDGIQYKSALGDGYNIALFDLKAAELTRCYLFRVKKVSYRSEKVKDAFYSTALDDNLDNK